MPSPQISVLIPAYFSDDTLAECLLSLRHQSFRDFEVILVNSSPDDGARRVAEQFPEVVFEQSPRRLLPHAARNRGAERARGEILVFTDPDCRADPDWLARLIEAHQAGHDLVCGSIELQDKPGDWFARGVHLCKYSFRLSRLRAGHTWVAGTANASCTRQVWESIGPFDGDRFAGDALYSWRAAAKTWQPWFEPRAITEHRYTGTFRSFCRERYSRGQDFADARVAFERWPRARLGMNLIALPVLVSVAVTRGAIEAYRAGWGRHFVWTFPLQVAGHAAWSLGEAATHLRLMLRRQSSERNA